MEKEYYINQILQTADMFIKEDFRKVRKVDLDITFTQMGPNTEANGGIT